MLGEKRVPGRQTKPEMEKYKGPAAHGLNLVSKAPLPKTRGNPFWPGGRQDLAARGKPLHSAACKKIKVFRAAKRRERRLGVLRRRDHPEPRRRRPGACPVPDEGAVSPG